MGDIGIIGGADGPTAIFMAEQAGFGALIAVLIVLIAALVINILLAKQFYNVAKMKGFPWMRYFWIPFLFGPIGWFMVLALPDHGDKV